MNKLSFLFDRVQNTNINLSDKIFITRLNFENKISFIVVVALAGLSAVFALRCAWKFRESLKKKLANLFNPLLLDKILHQILGQKKISSELSRHSKLPKSTNQLELNKKTGHSIIKSAPIPLKESSLSGIDFSKPSDQNFGQLNLFDEEAPLTDQSFDYQKSPLNKVSTELDPIDETDIFECDDGDGALNFSDKDFSSHDHSFSNLSSEDTDDDYMMIELENLSLNDSNYSIDSQNSSFSEIEDLSDYSPIKKKIDFDTANNLSFEKSTSINQEVSFSHMSKESCLSDLFAQHKYKHLIDLPFTVNGIQNGIFHVYGFQFNQQELLEGLLKCNLEDAAKQGKGESSKKFIMRQGVLPDTLTTLQRPIQSEAKMVDGKAIGIASCQGLKKSMTETSVAEDCSINLDVGKSLAVFSIIHGNVGVKPSEYVRDNLAKFMKEQLELSSQLFAPSSSQYLLMPKVIMDVFNNLNAGCPSKYGVSIACALMTQDELWIASFGNTRALFVKEGITVQLSEDSNPDLEYYKSKIDEMGAHVEEGKMHFPIIHKSKKTIVNISYASALGCKGFLNDEKKSYVSQQPFLTKYQGKELEGGFLILASHGLFCSGSTQEIGDAVWKMFQQGMGPEEIAKRLICSSSDLGLEKNVSVMVIGL